MAMRAMTESMERAKQTQRSMGYVRACVCMCVCEGLVQYLYPRLSMGVLF